MTKIQNVVKNHFNYAIDLKNAGHRSAVHPRKKAILWQKSCVNCCWIASEMVSRQVWLVDREFFSTGVIHELKLTKKIFLMPAVKTLVVKNAIMEYVAGTRAAISECKIHSASGHVESYTLVIIPNPNPKLAKSEITDQPGICNKHAKRKNIWRSPFSARRISCKMGD